MFHVGQKVVCVNARPRRKGLHPRYASTVIPRLRAVYTIRDIFDASPYGFDEPALLLVEIVNPVRRYTAPTGQVECEQFWLANRFRPVCTTNIDVFLKMLEPEPTLRPVEEEAADLTDEPVRVQMCVPPGFASVGWQTEPADSPSEPPRKACWGLGRFRRLGY